MEALLKNGALPNACEERDGDDCPPLYLAVASGHVSTVKVLISFGADVNLACYKLKTPLHIAVSHDAVELVEILLANGADVNALDADHKLSPVHNAFARGHPDILASILRVPSVNFFLRGHENETVLHLSAKHGHAAPVKIILDQNANAAYARSSNNCTALHLAAAHGHQHIVQLLVESGHFDIDAVSRGNDTPLIFAVRGNHVQTVRYLLCKGANVKVHSKKRGHSVLYIICERIFNTQCPEQLSHCVEMCKTLLSAGADVHSIDGGTSVLHYFCSSTMYYHLAAPYISECMQLLLAHGASKSVLDEEGRSPVQILNLRNPINKNSHRSPHPGHALLAT